MQALRRPVAWAVVLAGGVAGAIVAGTVAFASTHDATPNVINACYKPSNGTLYIVGRQSDRDGCQPHDLAIAWNVRGVPGPQGPQGPQGDVGPTGPQGGKGQDGVSVVSTALAPGDDPACVNGGTKLVSANGTTYACNGRNGTNGANGTNGTNGANGTNGTNGTSFNGSYTSPNGKYKLRVTNTGIVLTGPGGSVIIDRTIVRVLGDPWVTVEGQSR